MQRPCQAWQEHLALLSLKYWCGSKRRRSNTFPYFGSSELFSKQSLNLAEFFHQATLCMYTTSIIITWHICLESKSSWPLKLSPFLHKCKNYIKIAQPEKWQNFPRSEKRKTSPVMALSNHPPKPAWLSTSYRTFSPSSHSIPQFRDRILLTDCHWPH